MKYDLCSQYISIVKIDYVRRSSTFRGPLSFVSADSDNGGSGQIENGLALGTEFQQQKKQLFFPIKSESLVPAPVKSISPAPATSALPTPDLLGPGGLPGARSLSVYSGPFGAQTEVIVTAALRLRLVTRIVRSSAFAVVTV